MRPHSTKPTRLCAHCGEPFENRHNYRTDQFCSFACYAGRKVAVACQHCGETFHRKASKSVKSRYCSNACHGAAKTAAAVAEFWDRADKTGDCWLWQGSVIHSGYGRFTHHGKATSAHRFAFESTHGPIPDGLMVCHSCDNRRCVNPDHLFLGNAHTNTADMVIKGRNVRGERCHTAKLTEDQVRTIRRRHALDGVSQAQLGREFGVRARLVGRVIRRECWKHVA